MLSVIQAEGGWFNSIGIFLYNKTNIPDLMSIELYILTTALLSLDHAYEIKPQ